MNFERIDGIRSISGMLAALKGLPSRKARVEVILQGLAVSRFQFTWSFFAKRFRVTRSEWPPQP